MQRRLKILLLSAELPYPPSYGGARLKVYHVLKQLGARHDFTLLTLLESSKEREGLPHLREFCRQITAFEHTPLTTRPTWRERFQAPFYRLAYSEPMSRAIQDELRVGHYDLVHVDRAHMAIYTPLLAGHRKIIAATDSCVLAYSSYRLQAKTIRQKLRTRWLANRAGRFEQRVYPNYDACITVAEQDAQMIRQLCPRLPTYAIPNGVDRDFLLPPASAAEDETLTVFTGTMDFGPNVDAVQWFAREILEEVAKSVPDIHFQIIGRLPTPAVQGLAKNPRITVVGFVPDLRPLVQRAAVYVCPLRCGSGIKNKVLEAMAMGRAIVTTSHGVTGMPVTPGQEVMVADDPTQFAREVTELLKSPARRQQLGQAARRFVETNYSWERAAQLYEDRYLQVAQLSR